MKASKTSGWNHSLPIFERVIFVDWHGVMSKSLFWQSYEPANDSLPDAKTMRSAVGRLFAKEPIVGDWMRGAVSTRQVVRHHLLDFVPAEPTIDVLSEQAIEDCRRAEIDRMMRACIGYLRANHHVVLATDNMDCFVDGIRVREDLSALFDDFISSSEVGVLKAEDPLAFFGGWMAGRGIEPAMAQLIDDGEANCTAFETLGGGSILFDGGPQALAKVFSLIWPYR